MMFNEKITNYGRKGKSNEKKFMFQREKEETVKPMYYGKTLLRNPKKFMKNVYMEERYAG